MSLQNNWNTKAFSVFSIRYYYRMCSPHKLPTCRRQDFNPLIPWVQACWMRLCSSDNDYSTATTNLLFLVTLTLLPINKLLIKNFHLFQIFFLLNVGYLYTKRGSLEICKEYETGIPDGNYIFKVSNRNTETVWDMFKVSNKGTRITPLALF